MSVLKNSLNMVQTLLSSTSFVVRVMRCFNLETHVYQILNPATTFSDHWFRLKENAKADQSRVYI